MLASEFPAISDYTPEQLVQMADEHDDTAFAAMLQNNVELRSEANYFQMLTGLPNPFGNMVFGLQVPDVERKVRDVTRWITDRKVPAFWWVGPCTRPKHVVDLLVERGWKEEMSAPAMVIDLALLKEGIGPHGLELRQVTTDQELLDWQIVFSEGYGLPLEIGKLINPVVGGPMRLFTALLNGSPVGTTGLFEHKGVPGVYCVSTIQEHRGKGIGGAITAMPLIEAREHGAKMGTLQASAMGHPVYKKLGFQDVCQLRVFSINLSH